MTELTASMRSTSKFSWSTSRWVRWAPTFLGFPAGGALAMAAVGPVHGLASALLGGLLAGAVLGAVQWLALRDRLPHAAWWIPATAAGQAVGLGLGATLVGFQTDLSQLALQGAVTGLAIGILQGLVLRQHVATWFWWSIAMPPLWALGWMVTTAAGVGVDQHFTNFGASGAIVVTVLSGFLLKQLLRAPRLSDAVDRPAAGVAR